MINPKSFASDNNAGVHPRILKAIEDVNQGHVVGYGDDPYTQQAVEKFRKLFGDDIEVFFVFGGTAANVLGLQAATESFNAIICHETSHLNVDECGAPEKFTGCKLLTIPSNDGKITVDHVKRHLGGMGNEHRVQPKVISITQATELGTVYTPQEIQVLADLAHAHDMLLHMDGARLANAAVYLGKNLAEITGDVGVDIVSFGGTKNGMMFGDAIVFFNTSLAKNFKFIRKQGMQLASKMRFIAAQFDALLTDDLWRINASNTNQRAQELAAELKKIPGITITHNVESNGVFAIMPSRCIPLLQKKYFFYVWNEETSQVRLMTSFDTTEEEVKNFISSCKEIIR